MVPRRRPKHPGGRPPWPPAQRALARCLTQLYHYRGAALALLTTTTRPTPARHTLVRLLEALPPRGDVLLEP